LPPGDDLHKSDRGRQAAGADAKAIWQGPKDSVAGIEINYVGL